MILFLVEVCDEQEELYMCIQFNQTFKENTYI